MDPWFAVTHLGVAEAWAAIALAMVLAYFVLINTSWSRPSPHRKAFKRVTLLMVFTLILTFSAVQAAKVTVQAPRPCIPCETPDAPGCNPYCTYDYSFPSGHSATIFSVSTLAFLLYRRRWLLLAYVPACLVACSRLALGVHVPLEVAAGSLIGMASAAAVWRLRVRLPYFS